MTKSRATLSRHLMHTMLSAIIATSVAGCSKKESSKLDPALTQSLEAGITTVSGVADDASNSTYTANESVAEASVCVRALAEACTNGVQTSTYTGCTVPGSSFTMTGQTTLTYSNALCSLATGESVTRTYDYTITGPLGGQVQVTSTLHKNYLDEDVSGGGKLTHVSPAQWRLDVLGKHAVAKRGDETLFDASVHTTEPVTLTGSVLRGGRTMDGGIIEVNHNARKFTAAYEPSKLHWSNGCCHPVSGSVKVTYTGEIQGTGTVTFHGCGQASIEKEGTTDDVNLGYCE